MLIAVFLISSFFTGQGYGDNENELVREIMQGGNEFGCELYQELTQKGGSFVSSPLSAGLGLAMLMVGAGDDMFQNMASVLRVQEDDRALVEGGYRALTNMLLKRKRERNVTLEIANKLYVDDRNKVETEYQQAVKFIFQSEVEQVNFRKKKEVLAKVNSWVNSATHGKIKTLLGDLPRDATVIVLNAVYFYGQWKEKFNPDETKKRKFWLHSQSAISIPMMALEDELSFRSYSDFKALKLYYTGEDTSMLILLPREIDGLAALEAKLPTLNITRISKSLFEETVNVLLPKFKIETTFELNEPLKKMGLEDIFRFSKNFPLISNKTVAISKIIQKAFIEVTEKGTEAAAVTGDILVDGMERESPVEYFTADHPFIFFILDELTGGSLFMGRFTGQE